MNLLFKSSRRFFSSKVTEKDEQKSLVERVFRRIWAKIHQEFAFAVCFDETCDNRNKIPILKILKQLILLSNKKFKVLSHVCAIINEMIKQTNGIEEMINDSVHNSGTNVKPLKTKQETGRDKFSGYQPKIFAPPKQFVV
jgi:hypothetical protein